MAVALSFFLLAAIPAQAATLSLQATSDGNTVATAFPVGGPLYLNVLVDDPTGIAGVAFTVTYDATYVTPPAINAEGLPDNAADVTSIFPFVYQGTDPDTDTFRANGATAGKIYLSGAAINESNGGALYTSGTETVLFTIKFMVKPGAPIGTMDFGLEQTQLFNPAAGYGTDVNSNGVYDAGTDSMDPVPVLVGALPNTDPNFAGDLSDDFPLIASSFSGLPLQVPTSTGWTIQGTISYPGPQAGTLNVAAFATTDTNYSTPIGGQQIAWASGAASKAFTVSVPDGSYKLGAYIDSNANGASDPAEAVGTFTSPTINISGANDGTLRNFSLTDPDLDSDGLPGYWELLYGLSDNNNADAALDGDTDGYSNLDEFTNKTNPTIQDDPFGNGYDASTDDRTPYQWITTGGTNKKAGAGKAFTLSASYDTTSGDNTLSGLGLRIHYDSSKLTWDGFTGVLATSNTGEDATPQDDTSDLDGDATTDKVLTVAWADINGNWPNTTLPTILYTVGFTVNASLSNGDTTTIRFSSSSSADGYSFFGIPVTVTVSPFNLDVDGNGSADALTDGLLIIRYLFGFRGDVLIADAVAGDATRTTVNDIETYIEDGLASLDVDGNGTADALTDGLLIIRYEFGFRGTVLIADAVAGDATRTTAADIEAYIQSLYP